MDSLQKILSDVDRVFEFSDMRPQERAHEYLEEHEVARGVRDTAMQAAVRHMVKRAAELPEGAYAAAGDCERAFLEASRAFGVLMETIGGSYGD